jgi:hypothetical protein
MCTSVSARDRVSHPYKTSGKIKALYILTSTFSREETGRQILDRMVANVPGI